MTNNKYLARVQEELSIYQQYLLDETTELTPIQWETWDKIDTARAWLRQGYNDSLVISMLKTSHHIQDRRAREVLAMSYSIFAELRLAKDKNGVKHLYSEMYREAAREAKEAGDLYNFALLLKEAAKIDGAYDNQKEVDTDSYKKPTKVVFKIKQVINSGQAAARAVEDTSYENVK